MINKIDFDFDELRFLKKQPKEIYYIGDSSLIFKNKISIVGSRKPNSYAKENIFKISAKLSQMGNIIVSGGAMGIDSIAHKAAGADKTIMVSGTGLDKRYPSINKTMIKDIETDGLVLSTFKDHTPSFRYNFPLRNELIVALGEVLIVGYADINSGTMSSVKYALKMNKKIYVLPHRLNESSGTNKLIADGLAEPIYDIDIFTKQFENKILDNNYDDFLEFCKKNPFYSEASKKNSSKLFEYEILGKIKVIENKVIVVE